MGAKRFGLLDEILKRYEESFPGLLDKLTSSIVGLRIHAARRAEGNGRTEADFWLPRDEGLHGASGTKSPAIHCRIGCRKDLCHTGGHVERPLGDS